VFPRRKNSTPGKARGQAGGVALGFQLKHLSFPTKE
jgi:hypothetical protein